jgi:hypothetical protein
MQVTVKALLKPKDDILTTVQAAAVSVPEPESVHKQPLQGKKFSREPSTMLNFIAGLKCESKLLHDVKLSETPKRQKLNEKSYAKIETPLTSPEKESKNARKKRERKEQDKKLQASASKRR